MDKKNEIKVSDKMLYFLTNNLSQHISLLKYRMGYDNQNSPELDQALISANQTTTN